MSTIFSSNTTWSTESNAFAMSSATVAVQLAGLFWLNPTAISFTIGSKAVDVERKGRKPCCDWEGGSASVIKGRISLSRTSMAGHSREIGRYEVLWLGGLPGLSMGMILAIFQIARMSAWLTEKLNSLVK